MLLCWMAQHPSRSCQQPVNINTWILVTVKVKVIPQQAEVAQWVPGRLRPRIFLTFGTTRLVGRQPYENSLSPWFRLFSSQTFSRINTPTFSNLVILHSYPPMKMEQTECSETSAYKIQTPEYYPEESIKQHISFEHLIVIFILLLLLLLFAFCRQS